MSSQTSKTLTIFVDGSSRGNPGPAAIGIAVFSYDDQDKPIKEISKYIGITTNNVAEYEAVIHALKWLTTTNSKSVTIKLDSELVYKQITGTYKVRAPHIAIQIKRIKILKAKIKNLKFTLIPREKNKTANRLAQKISKKVKVTKKQFRQGQLIE